MQKVDQTFLKLIMLFLEEVWRVGGYEKIKVFWGHLKKFSESGT
jgi:hypothetical protein